jgi:hypothetical protein
MSKSYKPVKVVSTVEASIGHAYEAFDELADECALARDNFPNPDHPKAEAFGEAADALEGIWGLDGRLPEEVTQLEVRYVEFHPRRRAHNISRAMRLANASAAAQAAKERLESSELAGTDDVAEMIERLDEALTMAEGVEFPGLYG